MLLFAQIKEVYVINHNILLEVKLFNTIEFSDHLHCYIVSPSSEINVFVWNHNLCSHLVYGAYSEPVVRTDFSVNVCKYIILKYNVFVS